MPIEQDPAQYYQAYRASQQRVGRWVQETGRHLQAATPAPAPAGQDKVQVEQAFPAVAEAQPRASRRSASSKNRTHEGRSHSRPSSGSKKIKVDKTANASVPGHSGRRREPRDPSLSTYLPYGILPLLLAVTGRSALSVILGVVLLAGYNLNVSFLLLKHAIIIRRVRRCQNPNLQEVRRKAVIRDARSTELNILIDTSERNGHHASSWALARRTYGNNLLHLNVDVQLFAIS